MNEVAVRGEQQVAVMSVLNLDNEQKTTTKHTHTHTTPNEREEKTKTRTQNKKNEHRIYGTSVTTPGRHSMTASPWWLLCSEGKRQGTTSLFLSASRCTNTYNECNYRAGLLPRYPTLSNTASANELIPPLLTPSNNLARGGIPATIDNKRFPASDLPATYCS